MNKFQVAVAALALAGPAAYAQSLSAYGVVDIGLYAKQLAGSARTKNVDSGIMETSYIGFRGSEELEGGLRAQFDLSTFLRPDSGEATRGVTGEAFWSRAAWVGLSGPWGSLRLGRISTPNFINNLRFNPFGPSSTISPTFLHTYVGSPAQPMTTGSGATDSAWSNSAAYGSPAFAGFTVALQGAPGEGSSAGRRIGGSISYGGPQPVAATLSFDRTSRAALVFPLALPSLPGSLPPYTANDIETMQLGASYDFQVAKVYAQVARTTIQGTRPTAPGPHEIELSTMQLGMSAPIGPGRVLVSAARTDKQQRLLADQRRTTITVGYDHDLSKRTDLYAVALEDRVTGISRGIGWGAGIRHRF
jgi:predicted porin